MAIDYGSSSNASANTNVNLTVKPSTRSTPQNPIPTTSPLQEQVNVLIAKYTSPLPPPPPQSLPSHHEGKTVYLLTGANGMLGINLLLYLLSSREDTVVYCLLRASGEEAAWGRLVEGVGKHACLDVLPPSPSSTIPTDPDPKTLLHLMRSSARLLLLASPSFTLPLLGLSSSTYDLLRSEVDEIVHVAWPVSFNMKLEEFDGFLGFSRGLGELASSSEKRAQSFGDRDGGAKGGGGGRGRGRGVRYHFVGSTASTYNFPGGVVPERPVGCDVRVSLNQGYALSKLTTEHILTVLASQTQSSSPSTPPQIPDPPFHLNLLRIAQISGSSTTGTWNPREMYPLMIGALASGEFPYLPGGGGAMPDVNWIPVEWCVRSIGEVVTSPRRTGLSELSGETVGVYHIANPNVRGWDDVARTLGRLALERVGNSSSSSSASPESGSESKPQERFKLVSWKEYVERLSSMGGTMPLKALLPYFRSLVRMGEEASSSSSSSPPTTAAASPRDHGDPAPPAPAPAPGFAILDTTETAKKIHAIRECPPIDDKLLGMYVGALISARSSSASSRTAISSGKTTTSVPRSESTQQVLENTSTSKPISISAPFSSTLSTMPVVYMFGPWSALRPERALDEEEERKFEDFMRVIRDVAEEDGFELKELVSSTLTKQLKTLAIQLTTVDRLRRVYGIRPRAVVGYCFGEYGAALSLCSLSSSPSVPPNISSRTILSTLLTRANATRHITGSMLNIFAPHALTTAQALMARLPSPPELAIVAGPGHVVYSGRKEDIENAKRVVEDYSRGKGGGVKCVGVEGALPFHTRLMGGAVRGMKESRSSSSSSHPPAATSTALNATSGTRHTDDIAFISGLSASVLPSSSLTFKYWQRHMVAKFDFFGAMECAKGMFGDEDEDMKLGANEKSKGNEKVVVIDIGPGSSLGRMVGRYGWEGVKIVDAGDGEGLGKIVSADGEGGDAEGAEADAREAEEPVRREEDVDRARSNLPNGDGNSRALPSVKSKGPSRAAQFLSGTAPLPQPSISTSPSSSPSYATSSTSTTALQILKDLFGYSSTSDILSHSPNSLGLQSLDFILFTEELKSRCGMEVSLEDYVSGKSLGEILGC